MTVQPTARVQSTFVMLQSLNSFSYVKSGLADADSDSESSLIWHTFSADCFVPVFNCLFTLDIVVEYLQSKMKLWGLTNRLAYKIRFETDPLDYRLDMVACVKYHKRMLRYYCQKFLKNQGLRGLYRIIATSKTTLEFRRCL
jgi:hypothetical protein